MIHLMQHTYKIFNDGLILGAIVAISALLIFMPGRSWAGSTCLPGIPCATLPNAAQLLAPQTGPNSSKSGSEACDANFMNQIYAKAFLEAEREVVVNNAIIAKPDSILEYSCFDQQAAAVAQKAGPIFSESMRWDPTMVEIGGGLGIIVLVPVPFTGMSVSLGDDHLDKSIERLVLSSLKGYVDTNFAHDFLGGAAAGDNNSIEPLVEDVSDVCDFMYNVYHVAKCDDFALNAPFLTFEDYYSLPSLQSTDPRVLPASCPSTHAATSARVNIAKNKNWNYAAFDRVNTGVSLTRPGSSTGCENSDPIPTGVMVYFEEFDKDPAGNPIVVNSYQYEEKVCSNPACYFDHNGNASGSDDRCRARP